MGDVETTTSPADKSLLTKYGALLRYLRKLVARCITEICPVVDTLYFIELAIVPQNKENTKRHSKNTF